MAKVVSRDGTEIAFDRLGDGPPVILVGGALCDRSAGAPGLAPLLARHFTVFSYDRRGRGASGDTAPYAVSREVEDIESLVAEAGGSSCAFGISSGAALALEAAIRGVSITRLALFEPPFRVGESGPRPPADLTTRVSELISSGRPGEAIEFFLTKAVGLPPEAVAQMRNAPMWPGLEALAHTLVYDFAIMGDGSFPAERAASLTVPTLAIGSEASPQWLRDAVQVVADTVPDAEPLFLKGQFHGVPSETLAPVLEEFFGGRDASRLATSSRQTGSD
jgi:pimeloyl-ACP methyl ester carboxylesterase